MSDVNEQVKSEQEEEPIEAEVGEVMPDSLAPRDLPAVTLEYLAQTRPGNYEENLGTALETMRKVSIFQTEPEDWVLFRRPGQDGEEGRVTAYLQDSGCQRIMGMWKIEVMPTSGNEFKRERRELEDAPGEFSVTTTGNGICRMWKEPQKLWAVEGVRRSDEDFVKYKKGMQKEIEVRKASFANLNGTIVRRFTGLGGVAVRLLDEVWKIEGRGKTSLHCARGKGFGTQAERLGEDRNVEYGAPPACPTCNRKMVLRQGKRGPFWGCPGYPKCEQKPIDAKPVSKAQDESKREPGDEGPPPPPPPGGKSEASNGPNLGQMKYQLQERLAGVKQPWAKEWLKQVLAAKDYNSLVDLDILLSERLAAEGGK